MARSIAKKITDEMLVLRLLAGFHEDEQGRPVTSYPEEDSEEEKRARAVLARQIRRGTMGFMTKELLAVAINPAKPSRFVGQTRRIEFGGLQQGRGSNWARNRVIIQFITLDLWRQRRVNPKGKVKLNAAVHAAIKEFGLSRSQLLDIWKHRSIRVF